MNLQPVIPGCYSLIDPCSLSRLSRCNAERESTKCPIHRAISHAKMDVSYWDDKKGYVTKYKGWGYVNILKQIGGQTQHRQGLSHFPRTIL